jgi:hypothetical protein
MATAVSCAPWVSSPRLAAARMRATGSGRSVPAASMRFRICRRAAATGTVSAAALRVWAIHDDDELPVEQGAQLFLEDVREPARERQHLAQRLPA